LAGVLYGCLIRLKINEEDKKMKKHLRIKGTEQTSHDIRAEARQRARSIVVAHRLRTLLMVGIGRSYA